MPKTRISIRVLGVVFLSSILSYLIGLLVGRSSSWLPDAQSQIMTGHLRDITHDPPPKPPPPSSSSLSSSRHQKQQQLPHRCGIVFFYHIPSTGGASINTWLKKYSSPIKKGGFNYNYFEHWKTDFSNGWPKPPYEALWSEANFTMGMNAHVRNLGSNEWRIAHAHINSMYINETEELLYEWRGAVEKQGCHMINTIMLRDPLSHTMSLHKVCI